MRPTVRLIAFLLPVAYVGLLVGALLHEVAGHGLTALALGGTFDGFVVRWAGSGYAHSDPAFDAPPWHEIAIVSAGIAVTTVIGLALCAYGSTRRIETSVGAVCSITGAFILMSGLDYLFWSSLQRKGPGDPSRILHLMQRMGVSHFESIRIGVIVGAAIAALVAQWWGVRLALRHLETRIGNGRALSRPRRAVAAGVLAIVGSAAYLMGDYEFAIPGSGWVPGCIGSLLLLATAALVTWFPLPPFERPFAITRFQLIGAWVVLGLMAAGVHFWWNPGVNWGERAVQRSAAAQSLLDSLREAKDVAAVEKLAARVDAELAARRDEETRELLQFLGLAWSRVEAYERALASYERLEREFPEQRAIAFMLQLSALRDLGDSDAAASRARAFLAASAGSDRNIGLSMLAMVEERRGNWSEALAASEQWVPEEVWHPAADGLIAYSVRSNLLRIARCKYRLGRTSEALAGLESRLSDRRALFSNEIAITYVELAARSGRIEEARNFLATLPAAHRDDCTRSLAIVDAWVAQDHVRLLEVLAEGGLDGDQKCAAGRFLGDLGAPAVQLLSERIAAGDVAAIEAAGNAGRTELIPLLEKRYQASTRGSAEEREAGIALSNLETQQQKESRPASRPPK